MGLSYDDLRFAREELAYAQEDVRFAAMSGTAGDEQHARARLADAQRMVVDVRRALGQRCVAEAAKILGATVEGGR